MKLQKTRDHLVRQQAHAPESAQRPRAAVKRAKELGEPAFTGRELRMAELQEGMKALESEQAGSAGARKGATRPGAGMASR